MESFENSIIHLRNEIQIELDNEPDQDTIGICNEALSALDLFISDPSGNSDGKNDVTVQMMLPMVYHNVSKFDRSGKMVFYEQLGNIISLGKCSQGRTTRLLQFLDTGIAKDLTKN